MLSCVEILDLKCCTSVIVHVVQSIGYVDLIKTNVMFSLSYRGQSSWFRREGFKYEEKVSSKQPTQEEKAQTCVYTIY